MQNSPSNFRGGTRPIKNVSWHDVKIFIEKLNVKTGKRYRLPTEAEWEYAARGGYKSKNFIYSGSNFLDEVGWYDGNSNNKTHEVGKKQPNELGLYDMSGNVWEWCNDFYEENYYTKSSINILIGPVTGVSVVLRGGAWSSENIFCNNCYRKSSKRDSRTSNIGFRIVMEL